jgi:hypothetical protein
MLASAAYGEDLKLRPVHGDFAIFMDTTGAGRASHIGIQQTQSGFQAPDGVISCY